MTAAERWNGPIQDAIRRRDEQQGHAPKAPAAGRTVIPVDWFRRIPNGGGTVYARPDVPEETQ